jgi:DNA-binding beta-propeller fold protein YncE/predicted Ser/Thr protein kinase
MAVEGHIATGDTIAGYEVEELVGRGGMGEIYRARDPRLERRVALKLLAERYSEDEVFRERLLRESRIAASLDHPNVVPVYEAGEIDDRLFIAMRFVEGSDLEALLRSDGPLEPARALAIASQVAEALDAAHARGLVHRDVKPSNVLLDRQDRREHVYLADFGLTQSVSDRGPTDGHLVGTVDYVAPEQIRGDEVDGRADVYGLGCVLFQALTGSVPFSGVSDVAVIYAHLEMPPPRASERREALPEALDDVLAHAMAKDPRERQPTCGALVEEAREALGLDARPRSSRVLVLAAVAVVVALGVAAVGAVLVVRDDAAVASPGGSVVRIDGATGNVLSTTPTVSAPTHVAVESGQVWFATTDTVWRLDPGVGTPVKVEAVGYVHDLVGLDGRVYVARDGEKLLEGLVVPYDARSGSRTDGVSILACSLTASRTLGLWAAGCPNVQHIRIEPNRITKDRLVRVPFLEPTTAANARECLCAMTTGAGSVWVVGDAADRRVFRISSDGRLTGIVTLPVAPHAVAFAAGSLWVSAPLDDVVLRIDPATNRVDGRIPVGRAPAGLATAAGALWVALHVDGRVARIDPRRSRVVETVDVEGYPEEVASAGDEVWVASDAR